ncbi:MAG: hypothetical protein ISN29_11760 [Gammaproteobacteria bacterium AqS3]|nr:hypothetical protein [Gammaproteobacteria bacterium AqS3]
MKPAQKYFHFRFGLLAGLAISANLSLAFLALKAEQWGPAFVWAALASLGVYLTISVRPDSQSNNRAGN